MKKSLATLALLGGFFFLTSFDASANELVPQSFEPVFSEIGSNNILFTGNTKYDPITNAVKREAVLKSTGTQRMTPSGLWSNVTILTYKSFWFVNTIVEYDFITTSDITYDDHSRVIMITWRYKVDGVVTW